MLNDFFQGLSQQMAIQYNQMELLKQIAAPLQQRPQLNNVRICQSANSAHSSKVWLLSWTRRFTDLTIILLSGIVHRKQMKPMASR